MISLQANHYKLPSDSRSGLALSSSKGFTLIELLIYTGLTVVILGLLGGILVTVTRIQGVQGSSAQVTKELNFLMSSIKQNIHGAESITSISTDEIIFLSGGVEKRITFEGDPDYKVTLTDFSANPTTSDLSSSKIKIDDLSFTDLRDGSTASRTVQVSITASANTDNVQKTFTRTIESSASLFVQEQ